MLLKQSTAYTRVFLMIDSADHITGKTGLTVTVTLSKAGGAFGAAGGTVSEISSGWYKIALTTTDTNTLGDLAFHCISTGADPTDFTDEVRVRTVDDLAFPTVSGRSTDVSATGEVGLDFDNIKDATGVHTLTNITVPIVTTVNGLAAGTVTATAIATDAIDADALAADALTEIFTKVWTTALTEAYAADGVAPTAAQFMFMFWALLAERGISGVTLTAKKLDGSTTAMTFTLNDATTPTSQTRAS